MNALFMFCGKAVVFLGLFIVFSVLAYVAIDKVFRLFTEVKMLNEIRAAVLFHRAYSGQLDQGRIKCHECRKPAEED